MATSRSTLLGGGLILTSYLRDRLRRSYLTVLEEFDLAKTLLRLLDRLVWSAQILPLARQYLVAFLNFLDHDRLSPLKCTTITKKLTSSMTSGIRG